MKFNRLLVLIGLASITCLYAAQADYNLTPDIDTGRVYTEEIASNDSASVDGEVIQVIGAQEISATIVPASTISDTMYIYYMVSNDNISYINADADGDSTLFDGTSNISLHFGYVSTYRYHKIVTGLNTTSDADTIAVTWRAGARTSR